MKEYIFNWYRNEKYLDPIVRDTKIKCNDPQSATSVFMNAFGNLKINHINYIQEIDPETGENIGKPIIPNDDIERVPADGQVIVD